MLPRLGTPLCSNSLAHHVQRHGQSLLPGTCRRESGQFRRNYRTWTSLCNAFGLPSRHRTVSSTSEGHTGAQHEPIPAAASHLRLKTINHYNTPQMRKFSSTSLSSSRISSATAAPSPSSLVSSNSSARGLHSTASPPDMYTTSFAFFEALWEAGVTHVFVNLGSDHPSIIEAMVKGQREKKGSFPRIITCPNEVKSPPLLSSPTPYHLLMLTSPRWWPCPWPTATPA